MEPEGKIQCITNLISINTSHTVFDICCIILIWKEVGFSGISLLLVPVSLECCLQSLLKVLTRWRESGHLYSVGLGQVCGRQRSSVRARKNIRGPNPTQLKDHSDLLQLESYLHSFGHHFCKFRVTLYIAEI